MRGTRSQSIAMRAVRTWGAVVLLAAAAGSVSIGSSVEADTPRQARATKPLPDGNIDLAKLDGSLLAARDSSLGHLEPAPADSPFADTNAVDVEPGDVLTLDLSVVIGPRTERDLRAAGLIVDGVHPEYDRVSGRAPVAALDAIAALDDVVTIRREYGGVTNVGSVANQADVSLRSDLVRSAPGAVDGAGLTVGVLSDSLNYSRGGTVAGTGCGRTVTGMGNQASGDLPASMNLIEDLPNPSPRPGIDEGGGMAELIHDVAPGAAISFNTAFTGQAGFATGITALADCGADVIVDDVGYFAAPMFQDGPVAQAAQAAVDRGIPFFSSAGNSGAIGVDEIYVDGDPTDAGGGLTDLHRFPGGNGDQFARIDFPANSTTRLVMQWNEPYATAPGLGAVSDFDMHLVGSPSQTAPSILSADDGQGCGFGPGSGAVGDPLEILVVPNPGAAAFAYLAVDRFCSGDPAVSADRFRISITSQPGFVGEAGIFDKNQIYGHNSAAGAVAVAAIDFCEIDSGGATTGPTGTFDVEGFSSLGGDLPIYFDPAGNRIPGGPVLRPKPEITAPDGSNTTFFGSNRNTPGCDTDGSPNFFGTSAAAPHAAAVAALMLQATPGMPPSEVLSIMSATAVDAEAPGYDARSGAGFIDAQAAVAAARTPAPSVSIAAASSQADPATAAPIRFTATFDTDVTAISAADIVVGGTAGATSASTVTGGPRVFDITVASTPGLGTVTAQIRGAATTSTVGRFNAASNTASVTVASAAVEVLSPARFVDTRPTGQTFDDIADAEGKRTPGSTYRVRIAGRGGVPAGATAAVLNVTSIAAEGTGFVTVHPCLTPAPNASSLNYTAGVNLANEILAPLTAEGDICMFTFAAAHLAVDVVGYVPGGSTTVPVSPARYLDTRPGASTFDGGGTSPSKPTAGSTTRLTIAGRGSVPVGAAAAIVNVTAIGAEGIGFATVHPCLGTPPNAASVNFVDGANRANELVATLDATGSICIFVSEGVHLAADVVGYLPTGSSLSAITPSRLLDTRPTGQTVDGIGRAEGKRTPGSQYRLQVGGRAGVPASASAVVVNVTAVAAEGIGFVTVHPCLGTPPNASSLNYVAGVNGGNEIVASLDASGALCIFTSERLHLTVDVVGALQ